MPMSAFKNADLETQEMENTDSVALGHRLFVGFHKLTGKQGGMVNLAHAQVGDVAGIIEQHGKDTTGFTSVNNIPVGQRSRVRRRGITIARAGAVVILPGEKVYTVPATGKVTNLATGNLYVGVAFTETTGTDDEMITIDVRLG